MEEKHLEQLKMIEEEEKKYSDDLKCFRREEENEEDSYRSRMQKLDSMLDMTEKEDTGIRQIIEEKRELMMELRQERNHFYQEYLKQMHQKQRELESRKERILEKQSEK